eukprot:GFYU01006986.1.p1 GENE.GFYU01006986.1~~GFYU01006986.1.p1  ORF type:complete len:667 (-),score=146.77 GFYU01006986.1:111-2111(-)
MHFHKLMLHQVLKATATCFVAQLTHQVSSRSHRTFTMGSTGSMTTLTESVQRFAAQADQSYVNTLNVNPESADNEPNDTPRQVRSGHYVPVNPKPLGKPELVIHSPAMAETLGIDDEGAKSDAFRDFFSGQQDAIPGFKSWCTPYALSIMGQEMYRQCPFGNGNGYGDGRAISVAEVMLDNGDRWELQLKGGGTTPFCRGADGRAVLRSSIREFLVSEAMHNLGVSTTRALSLVVSHGETAKRAWYSDKKPDEIADDDPRFMRFPAELRAQIREMLKSQPQEPDIVIHEKCAITTRASPSFIRVGQVELYGRRTRDLGAASEPELRMLVAHLMKREYKDSEFMKGVSDADELHKEDPAVFQKRVLVLMEEFSQRLATLTAEWIRVGFCQGNFNSDNCLAGGRTMDYGPFGFVEKFVPNFALWVGSGDHYGFLSQPQAGTANYESFSKAVSHLLVDDDCKKAGDAITQNHPAECDRALNRVWSAKLGFSKPTPSADDTAKKLLAIMYKAEGDYTMLWRQLADVAESALTSESADTEGSDSMSADALLKPLDGCFYKELGSEHRDELAAWLRSWIASLREVDGAGAGGRSASDVASTMREASPKYIPREWMLVDAYAAAQQGDYSQVHKLFQLFSAPYGEGSVEDQSKYYRKAPQEVVDGKGGTSFMT